MPNQSELSQRITRMLLLLSASVLIGATAVYYLWNLHPELAYWQDLAHDGGDYLEAHPLVLVLILATLPGIGVPISPLLILFGIVMGPRIGLPMTCAIAIGATSFCTVWTYALASGPLRVFLKERLLKKWKLPELSERSALRLGLIIRITPGIPYALQNVSLGVMGMRFKTYLLVSLPIQSLYTIAFIVTSGALFKGQTGLAITGVLLLVVIILATRMFRNRTASHVG